MIVPEKSTLSPVLEKIRDNIARFRAIDKKNIADSYWHSQCTDSLAARIFFQKVGNHQINQISLCVLAADAYQRFIERGAMPPVVTRITLNELHCNAKALKASIPNDVPLPKPVQSQDFSAGLEALCKWSPSATVLTDYKGDSGRRWVVRELAKGFSHAFAHIPQELVHVLIQIGWPDTPLRSVQRELDRDAIALIHAEVTAEKAQEAKEFQAKTAADILIQRTNRPAVVLDDSKMEAIEALQAQIDRLRAGRSQFLSETQHFRAITALVNSLPNSAMAAEIGEYMRIIGRDYGLE